MSSHSTSHQVIVVVSLLLFGSSAAAQVLEPPPRSIPETSGKPADANRTRQDLSFRINVLGGYDDNLALDGGGFNGASLPPASAYVGFGEAALKYRAGRQGRFVEVDGRGFMNSYRNLALTPTYGGAVLARTGTTFGRNAMALFQNVSYDPFFSLAALGTSGSATNPTAAAGERRTWTSVTNASVSRNWTRRTATNLEYSFSRRTSVDGHEYEGDTHTGAFSFDRSIGRTGGLRASYRHSDSEFTDPRGEVLPTIDRSMELGFRFERRISRNRRIGVSGGGGATHLTTVNTVTRDPLEYVTPSGYANARVDLGRSWGLTTEYRRSMSLVPGVTPQHFRTHVGTVAAGGMLAARVQAVLTASYSNGFSGLAHDGQDPAEYNVYSGIAQLQFNLTPWWSAVIGVTRYEYQMNGTASSYLGVSPSLSRNALRVGFTWTASSAGQP